MPYLRGEPLHVMACHETARAHCVGWLVFSDTPSRSTLIGGVVICASTLWIARREARRAPD